MIRKFALIVSMIAVFTLPINAQDSTTIEKEWGSYIIQESGNVAITTLENLATKKIGNQPGLVMGQRMDPAVKPESKKAFARLWNITNCFDVRFNSFQIVLQKHPDGRKAWPEDVNAQIEEIMGTWWKETTGQADKKKE